MTLGIVVVLALAGVVGYLLYPEINTIEEQIEEADRLIVGGFGSKISTTTQSGANALPDLSVLKSQSGTLGSVIITLAGTGFDLYDATTTDIATGNNARRATSSILMAHIQGSLAAGVYEYNTAFSDGLLIDMVTPSTVASTTITWE